MLKRYITDFSVVDNRCLDNDYFLLELKHPTVLPDIAAGQFVEISIPDSSTTFLRRPISIHDVNTDKSTISLLIKKVGKGTTLLSKLQIGDKVNMVYPLGNGFSLSKAGKRPLLVGGGVGIAPLLFLAKELKKNDSEPTFLFGARNSEGLLRKEVYEQIAPLFVTTEDGSEGTKGFVVDHQIFTASLKDYTSILVCGPTPMMKAVATKAKSENVYCEVSLENKMACGIGVCLCCVTDTVSGHKCVCSDGPVFDINELKW